MSECRLDGCESVSPAELALPPGRTVEPLPVSASVMMLCRVILVMPWAETVVAVVVMTCYWELAEDWVMKDESMLLRLPIALEPLSGGVIL